MHVNADSVILEVVDIDGQPVEVGAFGRRVFVTNLENYVQPFIRYELGDVVAWDEASCRCGSSLPVIKDVSGRTDDMLYVSRADGRYQLVHPYWLMVPLLHFTTLREWQVVQVERNRFTLWLVPAEQAHLDLPAIEAYLRGYLRDSGVEASIDWHLETAERIVPDQKSGKVRRICSLVGPPAELGLLAETPRASAATEIEAL